MKWLEDRRPTLASWPKRIYEWSELPDPFRPALERWITRGMPPGNVTYIPKLRQGSAAREYATAWFGEEVLVQVLDRSGVSVTLISGPAAAVEYDAQLLKCTLTVHLTEGERVEFSYNKVKEDQLRPVISLLLGRPGEREFPTVHADPAAMAGLREDSYAMYYTSMLCYRQGDRIERHLWFRGRYQSPLYMFRKRTDPEYFLARTDRGMVAIAHDSLSTRALYVPAASAPAAELVEEKRGASLRLAGGGGSLTIPLLPGQEEQVGEFLAKG